MIVPDTIQQLKIEIIGRSPPETSSTFVVVRMSTPSGRSATNIFDLRKLSEDARPLHKMAAALGVVVLRPVAKAALAEKFEKAMATANTIEDLPTFSPALQPGWHGDVFVTPQEIYRTKEQHVQAAFTNPYPELSNYRRGSIEDWKTNAGRMMQGNPLLIFTVCAALMPPLLRLLEWDQGCGFALIGKTRGGKTSLSTFAGSVWGGGDQARADLVLSLRATKNGLEAVAPFANDRVLILDDAQNLPDSDRSKSVLLRDLIYMWATGRGKIRMGYDTPLTWLGIFFISHNQGLKATMADGRQKHDEAAEKRLIEIPCDRKYGVFDDIHKEKSASDFADALRRRSNRYNGAPIDSFLKELVRQVAEDKDDVVRWLNDRVNSMRQSHLTLSDADYSVGKYFCLAYAAGRFAEQYCDILPVSADEIRGAIIEVYHQHRMHLMVQSIASDPVASLRRYIDQNYTSLSDLRAGKSNVVQGQLAGYITDTSERKEYSFRKEQFAEAVAPHSVPHACLALKRDGLLIHDRAKNSSDERNVTKRTIEGERQWVYCVSDRIFGDRST